MFKRILVPVDGSQTSSKALQTALQMAKESGGCVRIVHLLDAAAYMSSSGGYGNYPSDLPGAMSDVGHQVLEDAANLAKTAGVQAETHLFESFDGRLPDVVSDDAEQWKADLVVVGSHGRRGIGRLLLGSGAEQIMRQAPVPVLVIRSDRQSSHEAG
ncbi:MAG: universal stress protein [Polaromonas sp.]